MRTAEDTRERVRIRETSVRPYQGRSSTLCTAVDTPSSAPHLTHQRQRVVLTVQKLGQPQVMVRHPSDNVGLSNKTDASRSKDAVRPVDVVHRIVND